MPHVAVPPHTVEPAVRLHENPFETVERCDVSFATFEKHYYVVHFARRGAIVMHRDGKLLLTAQYRFLIDGISWEIPGGSASEGEQLPDAARREVLEETGFWCAEMDKMFSYRPGLDNVENLTEVYYCPGPEKRHEVSRSEQEILEIGWFELAQCTEAIFAGEITDALTIAAILATPEHIRRLLARSAPE